MSGPVGTARVFHTLAPVWDGESRALVLGTMPSPKSRETGFYYGHPQNRFWPVLAALFAGDVPPSPEGRRAFALDRHIALWDVLASCDIDGAKDSTIRNPVANDIRPILEGAPIRAIFATGHTAHGLYSRLLEPMTGRAAVLLPSPSPANRGRYPLDRLVEAWTPLKDALS